MSEKKPRQTIRRRTGIKLYDLPAAGPWNYDMSKAPFTNPDATVWIVTGGEKLLLILTNKENQNIAWAEVKTPEGK